MSHQYSQKLIEETILCFKEEDGLDISAETANEYLDSFAGLFLAFSDYETTRPVLKTGGSPTQNLISSESCNRVEA